MAGEPLRALLIQSWVIPGGEVRDALRAAGYEPRIYRADFEPALVAALARGPYDIVILDCRSTGLSRATVKHLLEQHNVRAPLVELVPGEPVGDVVRALLASARN